MTTDPSDWFSCPNCGYDEFGEDEVNSVTVTCPDCGEETEGLEESPVTSSEEIAEAIGVDPDTFEDRFTLDRGEPSANDAEEVTENGIEFIQDEEFYKVGGETFECPECGSECTMSCRGFGFEDVAFCESCQYEFTRSREELVDDIGDGVVIQTRKTERDVYEEYECDHCGNMHPYAKPDGGYERPVGEVRSLEEIAIGCPCGDRVHFNNAKPGEERECECGRTFTLNMDE